MTLAIDNIFGQFLQLQGCINAKTVDLFYADKAAFKAYMSTLTPDQYKQALTHFNTCQQRKINAQAWRLTREENACSDLTKADAMKAIQAYKATLSDKQIRMAVEFVRRIKAIKQAKVRNK